MDAIILAAGKGTRMAPLVARRPKPLLPLAGKPILEHALERAQAVGVDRAVIVVGYLAEVLEQELVAPDGMDLVFVRQGQPRGTGHAVAQAVPHVDGDALLLMGDGLVSQDTLHALARSKGFTVAAGQVPDPRAYGVLEVEGRGLVALHEKPAAPPTDLANTGFYRVPAEALATTESLRPSPRGELEFTDVVRDEATRAAVGWVPAHDWVDVGNPWQYLSAHERMLPESVAPVGEGEAIGPGTIEPGVHVRGRLRVEAGAVVRSGTYVEGDVLVRAGARVGPNAYLRGPVEIGPDCHVGAATEIKNSLLLGGAKAPHHNYVGDSLLGHDCNLGSGTKLANLKLTPKTIRVDWDGVLLDTGRRKFGAVVGDGAKTGINCSLDPGTVVGSGATIGSGATVHGWIPPHSGLRG